MISAPLEMPAIPSRPTSAIAPNLLAGSSPFPALLQASQTGVSDPSLPDVEEADIHAAAEQIAPDQSHGLAHPTGLIAQLPTQAPGASFDLTSGRSLPQVGNLPPPAGSDQPLTAPNIPTSSLVATGEGEHALKATSPRVSGSVPLPVPEGEVIERETAHLPKHAVSSEQPKLSDGPEVSRRVKATAANTSETRPAPQSPGNSVADQPTLAADTGGTWAEVAAETPASREARPLRPANPEPDHASNPVLAGATEHDLVQRLERRPVAAAAALQTLSRADRGVKAEITSRATLELDPEMRASARPLGTQADGLRVLPAILGNADTAEAALSSSTSPTSNAQSNAQPNAQPVAVLSANAASTAAPSGIEPRAEIRPGQTIEAVIDQLAEARESSRSSRPELTLRHHEFGAINMRIEAAGAELRATLASRDPGFVPAVQAALTERAIAANSESTPGQSSRSSDQNSNQNSSSQNSSQGNPTGSGASSDGRYGSSTGSGQGSSQPYWEQSGRNEEDSAVKDRSGSAGADLNDPHSAGLFA